MPTYSYSCDSCGHSFDKLLKIAEMDNPTKEPCEKCSSSNIRKVIHAPTYNGEKLKATGGFREVIQKIKERTPHNNLPDY